MSDKGIVLAEVPELVNRIIALERELAEARNLGEQWCTVASEMLAALRGDYPPGQLFEKDGRKAVRSLQKERDTLRERDRRSRELLERAWHVFPGFVAACNWPTDNEQFKERRKSALALGIEIQQFLAGGSQ